MDNILGNTNGSICNIFVFSDLCKNLGEGDIIEFGTCSGESSVRIGQSNPNRKLFTIDHFLGLENSKKGFRPETHWFEGIFKLGDPTNPHIPKTKEEVLAKFTPYPNIIQIECDIHKLERPSHYGINKIAACNIDVDIYEPTVSSLLFIEKCEWNDLFIRFDDWHGHEEPFDVHERLAFKEWVDKNKYQYEVVYGGSEGGVRVVR